MVREADAFEEAAGGEDSQIFGGGAVTYVCEYLYVVVCDTAALPYCYYNAIKNALHA